MKKIRLIIATAFLAMAAVTSSFAQENLGESCGCKPLSGAPGTAREVSDLGALFTGPVVPGSGGGKTLDYDLVLDCNTIWTFDQKLYVINGATLTIKPGTVLKGKTTGVTTDAAALIISKGSKLIADGTASCPIIFTAFADPLNGTYPIGLRGQWGGIVLLGKAKNNLIVTNKYCTGTTGVGFVEGYDKTVTYNEYGMPAGFTNDNDNSGVLRYVSIRHAGAVIQLANELNGLTLASVGRGTLIDYVDIVANDDDGIEFFGGTVNVKHIAMWWGNDDMFDWDLGWKGNGQFLFGIASPDRSVNGSPGSDNGFEADGDDDTKGDAAGFMSHPVIYNATIIGDGAASTNDFTGPSAIRAKERTEGVIANSIFANFKFGFDISKTRTAGTDSYENWIVQTDPAKQLIVKDNMFVNMTDPTYGPNGITISTANRKLKTDGTCCATNEARTEVLAGSAEYVKFLTTDKNEYLTALPGFNFTFAMNPGTILPMTPGNITTKYDAIPQPQLDGMPYVNTGFFTPANYKGAFGPGEKNWLSDWSFGDEVVVTAGLQPCESDINFSGATNTDDLLKVLAGFGKQCAK